MKVISCICFVLITAEISYGQSEFNHSAKVYFSEQIALNINAYKYKIDKAEATKNYRKVAQLYREFINQKLIGSYLDNFNVDCFNRRKNNLGDFEKPLVLLTYADWAGPFDEQIELYNSYADDLHDKIDFLVLIWGDKKKARRLKKAFYRKTEILYVNELRNRDEHTVRMLKHALGVPTLIVTNTEKKIIDIMKLTPTFPNLFEYDFEKRFTKAIQKID
ncbi:hypothetical protein [Flavobacterium sp. CS20]|uniref:hypothetical protein n=1 Tax=Flavobacterium sp. CS20 TaxID=2775246 RepID=UPI001B39F446|nr:hypothetical protein [Flavobacterium sp. CS20]QTY27487.1 hypothetical protein IGB25_02720 [Flavobacterium sp. CS20]